MCCLLHINVHKKSLVLNFIVKSLVICFEKVCIFYSNCLMHSDYTGNCVKPSLWTCNFCHSVINIFRTDVRACMCACVSPTHDMFVHPEPRLLKCQEFLIQTWHTGKVEYLNATWQVLDRLMEEQLRITCMALCFLQITVHSSNLKF